MKSLLGKPFFLIIIVGFFLYLPSLFGKFVWDDEDFVFANKYVQRFEIHNLFTQSITSGRNKESNYFRPVQGTVYAATYQLVGPNPFWFHLLNILVHLGAAWTIFAFFRLFIARNDNLVPLLISLFFLIHPVQTEAVSYVSGLSDPLFVLFGFLALIFFELRHDRKNMLPLSVGFFILALLSKETGLVFLPILGLLILLKDSKSRFSDRVTKTLRDTLPFLATSLIYLTYHFAFINRFDIKASWGNTLFANSLGVRLLTFVQNLFTYVGLLLFPKDLFMERDYSVSIQTNFPNLELLLFMIISLALFYLIRKSKRLLFCYLAFFASFIPYTGIVLINGIFYEHFLYLPLVFFFAFWLILLKSILEKSVKVSSLVIFLFFLGLAARNLTRQLDWMSPVRFYSQTLSHAPQSIRVTNGLGIAYSDEGNHKKAIETFEKGIVMSPKTPNFYHNIANNYHVMNNFSEAEKYYLKALEVDPNFIFSWQSLAGLYEQTSQKEKLSALAEKFKKISVQKH